MKRFAFLAIPFVFAACGDNKAVEQPIDAPPTPIDSQAIDAPLPIDARVIDAMPPPPQTGTFTLLEAQLLGAPVTPANVVIAQGIQVGNAILPSSDAVAQHPDSTTGPSDPTGCKIYEFTPAQYLASLGQNEGVATVTVTNGAGGPATPPTFPACVFQAGAGYVCPDPSSSGTAVGVTFTGVGAGATAAALVTLPAGHPGSFAAEDVGRFMKFSGTGDLRLDSPLAAYSIVSVTPPSSAVIALGLGTGTNIAALAAGTFVTLGGVGPSSPFAADPGQLTNDASATISYNTTANGGGGHVANFMIQHANVGDDFGITDAVANTLTHIPTSGTFSLGCDQAGNRCGTSGVQLLNIVTTDAPVTGLSPFAFPAPMTKRVQIRCAAFCNGDAAAPCSDISVPPAVTAHLAGATRIQALLIRANLTATSPNGLFNPAVFPLSGHAYVGFTTP